MKCCNSLGLFFNGRLLPRDLVYFVVLQFKKRCNMFIRAQFYFYFLLSSMSYYMSVADLFAYFLGFIILHASI